MKSKDIFAALVALDIDDLDCTKAAEVIAKRPDSIVMRTERDGDGVGYMVIAVGGEGTEWAFEQGENERVIWYRNVAFGSRPVNLPGGLFFRQAARAQEAISSAIAPMLFERSR